MVFFVKTFQGKHLKFKKRCEIYLSSLTKMLMVSLEPGGNGKGKVGNGGGGGGGNSVCRG